MELYCSPGAGSLASHITIRELNLDVDLVRVDLQKKTESGDDYYAINPNGYVPFLTIGSKTNLSEGAAILQYLADRDPDGKMSARQGSPERYQVQQWLTFIGTELQRILSSFFIAGNLSEAGLDFGKVKLQHRLAIMDKRLADSEYLVGTDYTIADAYAFTILNWIPVCGIDIDLSNYENLVQYLDRIRRRGAVHTAMKEEGLLQ